MQEHAMSKAKELYTFSRDLIRNSQFPEGAWHAASGYTTYEYCWFRDSSYIAYAMDLSHEHESARRFHNWCFSLLKDKLETWEQQYAPAEFVHEEHLIHTRYTHDGRTGEGFWENHQLDGLGTWLWALSEHIRMTGMRLRREERAVVSSLCDYLAALWRYPCYDLWEEHRDNIHLYTLVSIYTGLQRSQQLANLSFSQELSKIRTFIDANLTANGHFVKMTGDIRVDASALGLYMPYGFVKKNDPLFTKTVEAIEKTLLDGGGVYRYHGDEFYGGGRWILLSCWLAWNLNEMGKSEKAQEVFCWALAQAGDDLLLPEQINDRLLVPQRYQYWVRRWGDPARPLLWSHAMYMLAYLSLEREHNLPKQC